MIQSSPCTKACKEPSKEFDFVKKSDFCDLPEMPLIQNKSVFFVQLLNGISKWHETCVALKLVLNHMCIPNFIKIGPIMHPGWPAQISKMG
jgi:hypothetical protein